MTCKGGAATLPELRVKRGFQILGAKTSRYGQKKAVLVPAR